MIGAIVSVRTIRQTSNPVRLPCEDEVEDEDVGRPLVEDAERRLSVARDLGLEPLAPQRKGDRLGDQILVLDDHDPLAHAALSVIVTTVPPPSARRDLELALERLDHLLCDRQPETEAVPAALPAAEEAGRGALTDVGGHPRPRVGDLDRDPVAHPLGSRP